MKVNRKVKIQKNQYSVKQIKKTVVKLCMKVISVDFTCDDTGTTLTLKTKNITENKYVMKGQIQSVTI